MRQIDFFFDFWSPYAYLASGRLADMAEAHGWTLRYCPIDLKRAKLAAGNDGPANLQIPPKIRYLMTDLKRWAARYRLPIGPVPKGSNTRRINIGALLAQDLGLARAYVREGYRAVWGEGGDPDSDPLLAEVATRAGIDPAGLLEFVASPEAAGRYETQFEEAAARGVFGVPIMLAGDEMWWGNDRLEFLEEFLSDTSGR